MKFRTTFLILFSLLLLVYSCQEPTQPEALEVPITIRIKVVDQSGKSIPEARIDLFNQTQNQYTMFGEITNANGLASVDNYPMPVEGETFDIVITPPDLGPAYTISSINEQDIFIGCADTLMEYVLNITRTINCGQSADQSESLLICTDSSVVIYSSSIQSTCPEALNLIGNGTVNNVDFTIVEEDSDVEINNIAQGGRFRVRAEFIPNGTQDETGVFTVTGTYSGGTGLTFNFELSAVAEDCSECDCPNYNTFFTNEGGLDPLPEACVGESDEVILLDLIQLRNSNEKDCSFDFALVKNFSSGQFRIVDGLIDLDRGDRQQAFTASFNPQVEEEIRDTVRYEIYRVNNENGERAYCQDIEIELVGNGTGPECDVINDSNNRNILIRDEMWQCPTQDLDTAARYIKVANNGACDLNLNLFLNDPNNIFSLGQNSISLAPKDTIEIEIRFLPKNGDVWPNGKYVGNPILDFTATLQVDFIEDNSCDTLIDLTGHAKEECSFPNSTCIKEWNNSGWNQSILVDYDQNSTPVFTVVNDANVAGARDLFVENVIVNGANGSVDLSTETGSLRVLGNRARANQNDEPCNWIQDYYSELNTANASSVNVGPNDVILFELNGFHGIFWIRDIRNDAATNGIPEVCYDLCYPID